MKIIMSLVINYGNKFYMATKLEALNINGPCADKSLWFGRQQVRHLSRDQCLFSRKLFMTAKTTY